MVVMATWDNHEELNRFVRQSNILWIDRALDYHAHYAVFEMIPAERSTYQMEPQLAGANFTESRPDGTSRARLTHCKPAPSVSDATLRC